MASLIGEKEGQATQLGRMLLSKRDKVFGGLKIARATGNARIAKWRVFQTEPRNDAIMRDVRDNLYPTRKLENLDANPQETLKSENKTKIRELSLELCKDPQNPRVPHESADEAAARRTFACS